MKIYLIRHTRPDIPSGICYGQTDLDTSDSFTAEVEAIKAKLKDTAFTHCFSSPLQRCYKLAKELAGKKTVHTDDKLMELNFGDWEMKPWEEINKTDEAKPWFDDYLHLPCPHGESYEQLQERVQTFIKSLFIIPDNADVLIVTHAGCIRSFLNLLEGQDPSRMFHRIINYGEIIKLTYHYSK